jgi:outer membrane protein assembly factor BamB
LLLIGFGLGSNPTQTSFAQAVGPTNTPTFTATPTVAASSTPTRFATATPSVSPTATPTLVTSQTTQATAYQVDPAHDGATQLAGLTPPLARTWTFSPGGAISYPLIAQGRVFVTVANATRGTRLYALDERDGHVVWGPADLGGTYFWSGLAYDAGRVFTVNDSGTVNGFDALTGAVAWSRQITTESMFSAPPTALQGIVYLGGSGTGGVVYALSETDGTQLWASPVMTGDKSSPALSDDGVFVSYVCPTVYKFDRPSGSLMWQYPMAQNCSGGGGRTAAYFQGRLYVRNPISTNGVILDSISGTLVGTFSAGPIPALAGSTRYTLVGGTLYAVNLPNGTTAWTFSGDGTLTSAPIVVNSQVYVGAGSGNLYALDSASGSVLWSTNTGAAIPAPDEQNVSQPLTGMNAGEGLLVVAAGNVLAAYGPAPTPTPTATPSFTPTATPTFTFTPTSTPSPTATFTPTATSTSTPTATATRTSTPTPTKKGHH